MIREKNIISGMMYEAEFYPVFKNGRRVPERAKKKNASSEEQANLNDKNARKKLVRLVNANFGKNDIVVHGTYRDEEMPKNEGECRRDIQNYIRRVKRYRKKQGLAAMKYIYVIESKVHKKTGLVRFHFHMIMNKMDRDKAEEMWPHGDWTNADRLQPNEKGCEALAKYLIKHPEGSKRWAQSKNLKKPQVLKPKDDRISHRYLKRLCEERIDDRAYWEKRYKGYRFIEANAQYNSYNGSWYLNVVLYRKE